MALSVDYDAETCARYVEGLGDGVLARARVLFGVLGEQGSVDSEELAFLLRLPRARLLPGSVNTRLKTRAAGLALPLPFDGGRSSEAEGRPRRTRWHDRAGIAGRMLLAVDRELASRGLEPATSDESCP